MSGVISVITAVHEPTVPFLTDAFSSLLAQELPDGWGWQWVVQEDGGSGADLPLSEDGRISPGGNRHGGPGVARTMGLGRARGALVTTLDADDMLLPGALARAIVTLTERPEVGWVAAPALDLLPDGSTVGWEQDDPAGGPLDGKDVFGYWLSHNYRPPVLPATACIRRHLVYAAGGWMALPASEDTGMLLAVAAMAPGWFLTEPALLYRKWSGQSTAQAIHVDPAERRDRMAVIEARVRALLTARVDVHAD